jgi:hypothetical protein
MRTLLVDPAEHRGERVRRNTRPYVGVIDWYDTINTDPFSKPVQYYGVVDIDDFFRPGILWRYRNEAGQHFQEHWSPTSSSWELTSHLLRMIIGGECSLSDMTEDQARKVEPRAFESEDGKNNVP